MIFDVGINFMLSIIDLVTGIEAMFSISYRAFSLFVCLFVCLFLFFFKRARAYSLQQ